MKSQNRKFLFLLLGFLHLEYGFVNVRADDDHPKIKYYGKQEVNLGDPWSIECKHSDKIHDRSKLKWTRNGQNLIDVMNGWLKVQTDFEEGTSILTSPKASENDEGKYRCADDDNNEFTLSVVVDVKIRVVTKDNLPQDLECPRNSGEPVIWSKDDVPIVNNIIGEESGYVKLFNETGTLRILKTDHKEKLVFGKYTCVSGNLTTTYRLVPKPTVIMPESLNVVEGEKLHVTCGGKIQKGIKIMWTFGGKNYTTSDDRVRLDKDERGINNAMLKVHEITMDDRGLVTCTASYNMSDLNSPSDSGHTLIRVKNKLAALWPFLGICTEVIILCTIILIYEKKRNKTELEESDTDQSPETKTTPSKDSDVRQRNILK